jgi:hypothetical protein
VLRLNDVFPIRSLKQRPAVRETYILYKKYHTINKSTMIRIDIRFRKTFVTTRRESSGHVTGGLAIAHEPEE